MPAPTDAPIITNARLINAPRDLVFEAWTDPKHLARWFGPNGFSTTTSAFDFRVGGVWRFVMHGPDGRDYQNRITFDEIKAPELLRFRHDGGEEAEDVHFKTLVTFEDQGGKTLLTLSAEFPSMAERDRVVRENGADEGGRQTLGRLADYVELERIERGGDSVFTLERRFQAPRQLVWDAFSKPEHLAKWWGPKGFAWVKSTLDFRAGGDFIYCMRHPAGAFDMWGRFTYREISAPERIVYVSGFSNEAGEFVKGPFPIEFPLTVLNLLTLEDEGGATMLKLRGGPLEATESERAGYASLFQSMRGGFAGTFEQLDALLAELTSGAS